MRLPRTLDKLLAAVTVGVLALVVGVMAAQRVPGTYAEGEHNEIIEAEVDEFFVTFYDEGEKLTVKTGSTTVKETLERAGIEVGEADIVEPVLDTQIDSNNFYINIHRARPVIVRDGMVERYVMTASYDPKTIAREAGITVYDGDEIALGQNANFLETGVATVYTVARNGGRTVTMEEEIAFDEQEVVDYALESGTREVRQLGETGVRELRYEVFYEDNIEVRRDLIGEEVKREPVTRIVAVGAKKTVAALAPGTETCAEWARQAGVSEADLTAAIDLIYHESGCRVNAQNASSGAYGIPQALPGGKMAAYGADWETNPVTQIKWMAGYVTGRYGGWAQALNYWYAHGWY